MKDRSSNSYIWIYLLLIILFVFSCFYPLPLLSKKPFDPNPKGIVLAYDIPRTVEEYDFLSSDTKGYGFVRSTTYQFEVSVSDYAYSYRLDIITISDPNSVIQNIIQNDITGSSTYSNYWTVNIAADENGNAYLFYYETGASQLKIWSSKTNSSTSLTLPVLTFPTRYSVNDNGQILCSVLGGSHIELYTIDSNTWAISPVLSYMFTAQRILTCGFMTNGNYAITVQNFSNNLISLEALADESAVLASNITNIGGSNIAKYYEFKGPTGSPEKIAYQMMSNQIISRIANENNTWNTSLPGEMIDPAVVSTGFGLMKDDEGSILLATVADNPDPANIPWQYRIKQYDDYHYPPIFGQKVYTFFNIDFGKSVNFILMKSSGKSTIGAIRYGVMDGIQGMMFQFYDRL